jgi:hypothetical protein
MRNPHLVDWCELNPLPRFLVAQDILAKRGEIGTRTGKVGVFGTAEGCF